MSYEAADASGFDEASASDVVAVTDRMTEMWWHVGQLRPAYLSYMAHAALPDNSSRHPRWREIAEELMPYMSEPAMVLVVRTYTGC